MTEWSADRLRRLLSPASVAVIGASEDPRKMGGAALRNLLHFGYKGSVYPVNPGRSQVSGLTSYASVLDCPTVPEAAVVAVPAAATVDALAELGAAGVRVATVVAAGFSEGAAGAAGDERARALAEVVQRYDLTVLGPNTTGLANLHAGYVPRAVLNSPDDLAPGPLAIVAQSGALTNTLMCRAWQGGLGVGLCLATGDELGVRVDHILRHIVDDPSIEGVLLALESVRDGAALTSALSALAAAGKPVVVLPVGRSDRGRQMAATHTGALTGDADLLLATLAATGAVVADGIDQTWQAWQLLRALRRGGAKAVTGQQPRIGVVAFSGGEASVLADRYVAAGVPLPEPSSAFADRIRQLFSFAEPGNPFDLTGEGLNRPDLLAAALTAALAEYELVHFAFPVFRDEIATGFVPVLKRLAAAHPGRLLVSAWPCEGLNDEFLAGLRQVEDLTLLTESERVPELVAVASPAITGSPTRQAEPVAVVDGGAVSTALARLPHGDQPLAFDQARELVTALGCVVPQIWEGEDFLANHLDQLPASAVYAKGYRPGTVHKAREGLVRGPLRSRAAVAEAVASLRSMAGVTRVEVEQEIRGLELILAVWRDPALGAAVTIGLGGPLAELLGQVLTFSAWETPAQVRQRFWSSRVGQVVRQHCGAEPHRLEFVLDPVWRLRASADELVGRFAVLEINPLVVDSSSDDVYALDTVAVPR